MTTSWGADQRRYACAVAVGLLAAALSSCAFATATAPRATEETSNSAPTTSASAGGGPGTALAVVRSLAVRGRGPRTGYSRVQFGPAWADVDRNGCDTRDDVLARDLQDVTFRENTHGCIVLAGSLAEPYTGRLTVFSKAQAGAVQIDHVVALSDAWQKGAAQWPPPRRLAFANDPLNLLAVDGPTNQAKGDSDAATWLPPAKAYRCRYLARQAAVKHTYHLSVTAAEQAAMVRVLSGCPDEPAPGPPRTAPPVDAGAAGPRAIRPGAAGSPSAAHVDPDYGTCHNAVAHGAGPYERSEPEYGFDRDADHDGTVCER